MAKDSKAIWKIANFPGIVRRAQLGRFRLMVFDKMPQVLAKPCLGTWDQNLISDIYIYPKFTRSYLSRKNSDLPHNKRGKEKEKSEILLILPSFKLRRIIFKKLELWLRKRYFEGICF
ncbi:hypothetical protein Pfo_014958 [Paulownia fortunei]|nr:hypothetical protein Pfo_014958 [Paulownia fortunei]